MPPAATSVSIAVEAWSAAVDELEELFPYHWRDVAVFQEQFQVKCDRARYAALEKAGALLVLTARSENKIVGYLVAFLFPHAHYFGTGLWALTDMYFVVPEARNGTGLKLFRTFEAELRRRDIRHAVMSCKVHHDHSELLEKLGWAWTDKTFQKHF